MRRGVRAQGALVLSVMFGTWGGPALAQSPAPSPSPAAPASPAGPSPSFVPFGPSPSPSPAPPSPSPAPSASPVILEPSPSPVPTAPPTPPGPLPVDQIRYRERMALISLSTVVAAQKTYAALNYTLYDSMTCLMRPAQCIPGLADPTPVLDPGYQWTEPRLGYVLRFHPGPGVADPEIRSRRASPSSISSFAVTLIPQYPGLTGGRAFCGDSAGRMCFTSDGAAPPVRDGRCEPCKKLQ